MYIISACLVGENCKYNGGNNECQWVVEFAEKNRDKCILVCPEIDVFSAPRLPMEIVDGKVINKASKDVTNELLQGIEKEWEKIEAISNGKEIEFAILKANSPSCGNKMIYDGTFSGKLIEGEGFFAKHLREKGIKIYNEHDRI